MKNQPYVKQYDENKVLLNPITVDNPYLHSNNTTSFLKKKVHNKYRIIENPVTKAFIAFGNKLKGNNRAHTKYRKARFRKTHIIHVKNEE